MLKVDVERHAQALLLLRHQHQVVKCPPAPEGQPGRGGERKPFPIEGGGHPLPVHAHQAGNGSPGGDNDPEEPGQLTLFRFTPTGVGTTVTLRISYDETHGSPPRAGGQLTQRRA